MTCIHGNDMSVDYCDFCLADRRAPAKPRLLILGHARHGKDTTAEILRDRHGFSFTSSSYFLADNVVRPALAARGITYADLAECYADRVNHRAAWRDIIAEYNGDDPAKLAKAILDVTNVYVGMRTHREYVAARPLFDVVVWVDAAGRGLPPEGRDSMDIEFEVGRMFLIDNNGTFDDLAEEVADFVRQTTLANFA